ncbi:unnamed protein product [Lactuca saligna]|uniref:Uncharacterized protein n=1 Tax=Lactuca saligna TaxID=75948 RepID=A0AA36E5A0_LACSI|nr:unnamed protein product [Lactuca saligna]
MGYKFEDENEPCLSRIRKSCLPTPWNFLSSVLARCFFGSVGGRSRGKTDLWILIYWLFYDINVDYASILWEYFLNFLPASKNKFLIHHPRWWSIIIYDTIHNSNIAPEEACRSCIQEVGKEEKEIQIKSTAPIPSPTVSDDNHGADLGEPTSLPKSGTTSASLSFLDSLFQAPSDYDEPSSSSARVQSVLESPIHHVSLDYDLFKDDNQDDDKQSEPEAFPQGSPVQDNHDEDTPMQTVDIPSGEGLIVDDETNDMSIVLYSNASTRAFNIDLDDYSPPTPKDSQENDNV